MIPARELAAVDGVAHGFFDRRGGVSRGLYASRNCGFGSGDERADVAENRRRAAAELCLAADRLATLHQVHGTDVVRLERARDAAGRRADAMVSREPGLALGILGADCAPVLLADGEAGVVGAAHAGWAGALAGVAEATVAAMTELGARAERIVAAVGPCIGPASYEVGPEFRARFLARRVEDDIFFAPAAGAGRHLFDLPGYVLARLRRAGVGLAERLGHDTCAEADRFFSYRRSRRRGETDYGRQLSAIARRAAG